MHIALLRRHNAKAACTSIHNAPHGSFVKICYNPPLYEAVVYIHLKNHLIRNHHDKIPH